MTSRWMSLMMLFFFLGLSRQASSQFGKKSTTRAVIIGISDYQNPQIPDLKFAHRDAQAMADYLRSPSGGQLPEENIRLLTNAQATGGNVHKALYWMVRETKKNDVCIFYFSGHGDVETDYGDQQGHFLVYDSPSELYQINSVRMGDLQNIIQTLSSVREARVIVYSDACRSGSLAGSRINGPQATAAALSRQFANEVKLLSCQPNEFSVEGEEWGGGRGLFSYILLDGMRGLADEDGDYVVRLKEIETYLDHQIPRLAPGVVQTPVVLGNKSMSMAIVDPRVLDSLMHDRGEIALIENNQGMGFKNAETDPVTLFYQALEAGHYLKGEAEEGRSAEEYFLQMESSETWKNKALLLRGDLISALQDEAQASINAYLSTDPKVMAERWGGQGAVYEKYGHYLQRAAQLMGPFHYMYPQMRAKSMYFQVVAKRLTLEAREVQPKAFEPLLDTLTAALILDPNSAFINNEMGLLYASLHQWENARQQYQTALRLSPTWALPYNNLAYVFYHEERYEEALESIERALEYQSDFPYARILYTRILDQLGQGEQALVELKSYIHDYGTGPLVLNNYGKVHSKRYDNGDTATYYYRAALSIDSNFVPALKNMGNEFLTHGQLDSALIYFEKSTRASPRDASAFQDLGTTYFKMQDYDRAILAYKRMLGLNPLHPYRVYLANAYMRQSQWEEAIQNLVYYIQNVDAEDGWSYFDLACCHAQMKNEEEAIAYLKLSIVHHFSDLETLEGVSELEPIRETPEYIEVLQTLKER